MLGHFNPLTGLAKYLQETMGCEVKWYTSASHHVKLAKLGIQHFHYIYAKDVDGLNIDESFPQRSHITDAGAKLDFDMKHVFARRGPEYYKDIADIYKHYKFDALIADSLFTGIPFVSKKMQIPVINIGIIPLAETSDFLAPYGMALHPPKNEQELSSYKALHQNFLESVFKESIDEFNNLLSQEGIPSERSVLFDVLIKQSDTYLQIGLPSFEYPRQDMGKNIHFIGALLPHSSQYAKETWHDKRLDTFKFIILVTQGTIERDITKILEPTLEALQHKDVLVLVTTGGNGTKELRSKYNAPNVIIEDFLPFDDVMPKVDLYISNGGYSGTLLAIKHKLPMVVAGLHEGKSEICARIGYFEYGIDLRTEYPKPEQISAAVEQISKDRRYKENVDRLANELTNYPSYPLSAKYIYETIKSSPKKVNYQPIY